VRTLLVVDDEVGITEALRELLSEEGFLVLTARNGREGLERVAEKRPDLIVLDYMMPVMDGREMMKALEGEPTTRDIPVLLVSAMPRASLPADCKPMHFLRKPFNLDQLLVHVRRLLGELPAPVC
jgi:CheY-like chemotaxis protein